MQFMNPVETPFRFVEDVGNPVRLRPTQGIDHILEFISGQLETEQHSRGRVSGRDQILQLIACIVPTTTRVHETAVRNRSIHGTAIAHVTNHIEVRVVTAPLLAHEEKQVFLIGRIRTDGELS